MVSPRASFGDHDCPSPLTTCDGRSVRSAEVAEDLMTYRRDSSDIEVVVRPSSRHDRPADTPVGRAIADTGVHAPHSSRALSTANTATPDASFATPFRRAPLTGMASQARAPESHSPTAGIQPEVILVKSGFKQVATRVREIVFVEAARNYVRIHLETGQVLKSRVPIDRLGLHLGRERFLRVHRGCLVNIDRIRGVTPLLGGRLLLSLCDGSKVAVARDRRRVVLAEIGAGTTPR